ncbi:response regulator [Waterburya agarophytonicola K14]|uniref:Response regulator n=1 Tax=Waterburya agarophytonicola KI4 TaxID=2874699 RepID=A0A964FGV8_9CYAN|nr:response regulator [Waterburya agarophytonicola]MCC0176999.1 response regulator [Waterburya agarophytonicola KI4]
MSLTNKSARILVVDDNNLNLDLLCKILSKANFRTITAVDGIDAIKITDVELPHLILLDAIMPNLDGFEACKILKKNPKTQDIPIIFMTSVTDTEKKVKAFELGANDYITKPFHKPELLARVKSHLQVFDLSKTLKYRNHVLQNEVEQRYEAEISLLDINERLADVNQSLKAEIENRKLMALRLQAEILERKKAEKEVKKSLKEKNLLLKEIHHRVKNNLFIVSSLLESQGDYIDNPEIIKVLSDSQNRITTMALIHEQLHYSTGLCEIDFQQYLTALIEHITNSYLTQEINFKADIQQAYLNIETAHPCGLIINELISNAVEHAFPEKKQGNIILKFCQDKPGNYNLWFKDDGIGFPDDKDFYHSESLGLELVVTLVEQLEGKIEMNNNNGTEISITFAELDYKSRMNAG